MTTTNPGHQPQKHKKKWTSSVIRFLILFVIWLILSAAFDAFHVIVGLLCCLFVEGLVGRKMSLGFKFKAWPAVLRFLCMYLPWLMGQIIISNLQILRIVLHPNLKAQIDPQIVTFQTKIKSETGRYILANSITLTPGTTTIYASRFGDFTVHALNGSFAAGVPGVMETKIMKMLGESDV